MLEALTNYIFYMLFNSADKIALPSACIKQLTKRSSLNVFSYFR